MRRGLEGVRWWFGRVLLKEVWERERYHRGGLGEEL